MALLINRKGLKNVNGGQELPETGIFCRFDFETNKQGLVMKFDYNIDKQAENTWGKLSVVFEVEEEVPVVDADRNPTGKFETMLVKRFLPTKIAAETSPAYSLAKDKEVDAYYNTIKATPLGKYWIANLGQYTLISQCVFHVLAKNILEEVLGIGTVEIRLDLI